MSDILAPDPEAPPVIELRCATWRKLADSYARDLASGGLYVEGVPPVPLLSSLEVRLQLPEATEVRLRARVVQVLGALQAAQLGKSAGFGLELLDIDPERKRQIAHLLEFAAKQGPTDDPSSSFARTLLELSPSLPPHEVGARLSQVPGTTPAVRKESRPSFAASLPPARDSVAATRPISRPSLPAAPSGRSTSSMPAVDALRARRASGQFAVPSQTSIPAQPAGTSITPGGVRAADQEQLKLLLSSIAHKHYDAALKITQEMLAKNPSDTNALRWQGVCNARAAIARGEQAVAAGYYEQLLQYDPEHREAREFVRAYERDKKLSALPFGRYFTKKK
ncbi:MAG: PilZ domain-containing protein [Polyangiales bacterium]